MTNRPITLLVCGILALSSAGIAVADGFQTFSGNTVGAPTWTRPGGGTSPTISGAVVRYRVQRFKLESAASCTIYSAQDYDGYLHLYRNSFNPNAQLTNLIDGDDDGELGIGTSRIPSDQDTSSVALTAGTYFLVTSAFSASGSGSYQTFIQCTTGQPIHGSCSAQFVPPIVREDEVCLQDRFVVVIDGISNHPTDGIGTPVRFGSSDSAFFWFYNDRNFEVLVKVLNGCPINGHWWVFFAATTNQAFNLRVGDSDTVQVKSYPRTLGPPSPAETDTQAFPCP